MIAITIMSNSDGGAWARCVRVVFVDVCAVLCFALLGGGTVRETNQSRPPLRWAIGGRDEKKLNDVKEGIKCEPSIAEQPTIIIADANDRTSVEKMTAQARCIIATVGPFSKYGENMIAACIRTGTDYVDITGETIWVSNMIAKYGAEAEKNGVIISNMCGFDSIPSDLGAYLAAAELKEKHQTEVAHMQGFTSVNGGGISGGTIASIIHGMSLPPEERKKQGQPYLLNPPNTRPAQVRAVERDQRLPRFDSTLQKWTAPWLMSLVNTRVVRRSLALRKTLDKAGVGFGENASYNECMPLPSLWMAVLTWLGLVVSLLLLALKPTQALLTRYVLPAPGEGPSKERRAKTTFSHRVIATGEDGSQVQSIISGGDPGYQYTARMVGECGLLLAQDRDRIELNDLTAQRGSNGLVGGFFTPSVVGARILAERLRGAGMGVRVEPFNKRT